MFLQSTIYIILNTINTMWILHIIAILFYPRVAWIFELSENINQLAFWKTAFSNSDYLAGIDGCISN